MASAGGSGSRASAGGSGNGASAGGSGSRASAGGSGITARTTAIRIAVIVVCAGGVAGMVIASALNHNGAALTFGVITAIAILCQMVATTVLNELRGAPGAPVTGLPSATEREAEALEQDINGLVNAGAEEVAVRDLVRRAIRLGRESHTQTQ